MRIAIVLTAVALLIPALAQAQTFSAVLNGAQETPAVTTAGTGSGSFTLNASKILSYSITFSGLSSAETAAHIHCCAAAGTPAGPLFTLPAGNPKNGTFGPLTAQQEADLQAGLMYVNIHTSNHSGGEIRGQILSTVPVDKDTWSLVKCLYK